jgi:hypothetical protein
MPSPVNPYESPRPETGLPPVAQAEYVQVAKRSVTPLVMGALSFVWGGGGLLLQLVNPIMMAVMPPEVKEMQQEALAQSGYSMATMYALMGVSAVISLVLCVAALGLVTYRGWGRTGFNIYGALCLVWAVVSVYLVMTQTLPAAPQQMGAMADQMETFQRVIGVISTLFYLVFPVLGMVLLNRQSVVASLK